MALLISKVYFIKSLGIYWIQKPDLTFRWKRSLKSILNMTKSRRYVSSFLHSGYPVCFLKTDGNESSRAVVAVWRSSSFRDQYLRCFYGFSTLAFLVCPSPVDTSVWRGFPRDFTMNKGPPSCSHFTTSFRDFMSRRCGVLSIGNE